MDHFVGFPCLQQAGFTSAGKQAGSMLRLFVIDLILLCRHFNMVVIDEATQATEPATLVPLTQVRPQGELQLMALAQGCCLNLPSL
jgi:hypothetical protein